jgi:Glyoxalase-like domain
VLKLRDDLHMTSIGLVLDCADPVELAKFWAPAPGYTILGDAGAYVLLVPPDPSQPKLLLQRVPEARSAKNRMHVDIEVADDEVTQPYPATARPRGTNRHDALGAPRVFRRVTSGVMGATMRCSDYCPVCRVGVAASDPGRIRVSP